MLIDYPVAIECEGGQWINGAHNRGKHFESDIEKYNEIALSGLRLLRFNAKHIKSGYAASTIENMIRSLNENQTNIG